MKTVKKKKKRSIYGIYIVGRKTGSPGNGYLAVPEA